MSSVVDQQNRNAAPLPQPDSCSRAQRVIQAIKLAAARTNSDFANLLHTAGVESGFNPNAKSKASSATGLFQFTGQTWLQMVKSHGAQYGLGDYAEQIQIDANGEAHVADPASRQTILDLRKDPQISAEMTCELDKANSQSLQKNVGGTLGPTELYLAHFLGAGGASAFLKAVRATPNATAASILPKAAEANSSVFYDASGQPRSVGQIYQHFAKKFDPSPVNSATPQVLEASLVQPAPNPSATVARAATPSAVSALSSMGQGQHMSSQAASSIANVMLGQMDMAYLSLSLDDESDSAISVRA